MNFVTEFKKGQTGGNRGIPLGMGLANVSKVINGIQRGRMYGIASPAKTGKSTLVDVAFLIEPYLYSLANPNIDISWVYFSFEIDRISKEFEIAAHFMVRDHQIEIIELPEGKLVRGLSTVEMSPDYLRGRILDDEGKLVKIFPEHEELVKQVYSNRIIPIFGKYSSDRGILIKPGAVEFIAQAENPTGLWRYLMNRADRKGHFIHEHFELANGSKGKRIIGYKANNPEAYNIIITDHLRKLGEERGWNLKQVVDKYISYTVGFRNWCDYTFAHILHTNRNLASETRIKFQGEFLYPGPEDLKDTGNLSEECDYLFTMFNPNDTRYNLTKHFGLTIRDTIGNVLYPNMKTLHLVESRHCMYPVHFRIEMNGASKSFGRTKIINE